VSHGALLLFAQTEQTLALARASGWNSGDSVLVRIIKCKVKIIWLIRVFLRKKNQQLN
jgi:hypothetical protein